MEYKPHPYQVDATGRIVNQKQIALFLDMGLGKTVCTLTAIHELMFDRFDVRKVLVVAPLRVAEDTWSRECEKWDHLEHIRISKVLGTEKKRLAALKTDADVYIINRENVEWLVKRFKRSWPFDMVVIDELSSFKNERSKRFAALKEIREWFDFRIVGLTGTPVPNGYTDLWAQMYLIDLGKRLGDEYAEYLQTYFEEGHVIEKYNKRIVLNYTCTKENQELIQRKIEDVAVSMRAKDWLDLPDKIQRTVYVQFDEDTMLTYKELQQDLFTQLGYETFQLNNPISLPNKLLQICNGCIYNENGQAIEVHNVKLNRLEELVEEANGHPVLIYYTYRYDCARIMDKLKRFNPQKLENADSIRRWNRGEISVLLAHPASAGHGLNLQDGGNIIIWFGLTWSLELYEQANARLHRQGQKKPVFIHHLIVEETVEETVMFALKNKQNVQNTLMESLKAKLYPVKAKIKKEVTV